MLIPVYDDVMSSQHAIQPTVLVELAARLVYSLLKAAVGMAARFGLPLDRLIELTQIAYFEEHRRGAPRDLATVAAQLGVSLRTAGTLNKKLKGEFFAPERDVEPIRRLTGLLTGRDMSLGELRRGTLDLDPDQLRRALRFLIDNGWVEEVDARYRIQKTHRSFVTADIDRRIDALNNQIDILSRSVWSGFIEGEQLLSRGRSWVFAARQRDIPEFIERTLSTLRHSAIDLEQAALDEGTFTRYGVTLAFAPIEESKDVDV